MITVYQYIPAWGLPCISPYVTKLANYLTMTGMEHELIPQDLTKLDDDSPYGKLPYIVDADGTKVGDSNEIIGYLKAKYGDTLDADLTAEQRASALAWNRFLEEHYYWHSVIQPRWREEAGWKTYIPFIVGGAEVTPPLQEVLDAFRQRILAEFDGQGMGRRPTEVVYDIYKQDTDALSDFLGDKTYFFGDQPHGIDASVYSSIRHVIDTPFPWMGVEYMKGKRNLVDYANRMREKYGI